MAGLGPSHLLILLLIALIVFGGKGKISSIMGDVADGIKSFKKGLSDDAVETAAATKAEEQKAIEAQKAMHSTAPTSSGTKIG